MTKINFAHQRSSRSSEGHQNENYSKRTGRRGRHHSVDRFRDDMNSNMGRNRRSRRSIQGHMNNFANQQTDRLHNRRGRGRQHQCPHGAQNNRNNFYPPFGNIDPQQILQDLGSGNLDVQQLLSMLQNQFGLDLGNTDIGQLLQQAGLMTDPNGFNNDTGAAPDVFDNGASSPGPDVQQLLASIDPDELNQLLQIISPEEIVAMLRAESGIDVSANDITSLLQQLTSGSTTDQIPSNPIPVEPNNGIGDGAGPIPPAPATGMVDTTTPSPSSNTEIQQLLEGINPDELMQLLQIISPEEIAAMLQADSGISVSADDVSSLIQQIIPASGTMDTGSMADSASNDAVVSTPAPIIPDTSTSNSSDSSVGVSAPPAADTTTPPVSVPAPDTTSSHSISANPEVQQLLQSINPDELNQLLQLVSAEEIAAMLKADSGVEVSADDINQLIQQLTAGNTSGNVASPNPTVPDDIQVDSSTTDSAPTATMTDQVPQTPSIDISGQINSVLQGLDSAQLNMLLEMISPEEIAQMFQQETGTAISSSEVKALLQQIGLA